MNINENISTVSGTTSYYTLLAFDNIFLSNEHMAPMSRCEYNHMQFLNNLDSNEVALYGLYWKVCGDGIF